MVVIIAAEVFEMLYDRCQCWVLYRHMSTNSDAKVCKNV